MDVCDICRVLGDDWEMDEAGEIRHACDSCAHAHAADKNKEGGGDPPAL